MRYRNDQTLDDSTIILGDTSFMRLNTRTNPTSLQEGELQVSENMRLDDGVATPRKGLTNVNAQIVLEANMAPIIIPFVLAANDLTPVIPTSAGQDGVYASGIFSDPANDNQEWVMLAAQKNMWLWRDGETAIAIAYPAGEVIFSTDNVHLEQANEVVYLFRGYNDTATTDGTVVWDAITADVWLANTAYYIGDLIHDTPNNFMLECTTAGTSHSSEASPFIKGTGKTEGPNTLVWTVYTLTTWSATATYSSTYNASNDTFATIDGGITTLRATTGGTSGSTEPDMRDRPVLKWNGVSTGSPAFTVCTQKRPTEATHRPLLAAPWSLYYRNRIIKPVSRTAYNMSGIITPEDFDTGSVNSNEFKPNYGGNDYLVGAAPFQEDSLLLFYRKSIFLATDIATLTSVVHREVIRGIGCAARKTIVSAGDQIYWLGDNGIYSLNIVDQLNLKSVEIPLTRDIDDIFATINMDAISTAHGIYHNNRLYFAVPTGTKTRPDRVLIYNLLNQGWESVDWYGSYTGTGVTIDGFEVAEYSTLKRLIIITRDAALYVAENNTAGDETGTAGSTNPALTNPITSKIRTRAYNTGHAGVSRWRRATATYSTPGAASFGWTGYVQDPDQVLSLGAFTNTAAEDNLIRRNISKRGYACDLTFISTAGRPSIKTVAVEATQQYRTGDLE